MGDSPYSGLNTSQFGTLSGGAVTQASFSGSTGNSTTPMGSSGGSGSTAPSSNGV